MQDSRITGLWHTRPEGKRVMPSLELPIQNPATGLASHILTQDPKHQASRRAA